MRVWGLVGPELEGMLRFGFLAVATRLSLGSSSHLGVYITMVRDGAIMAIALVLMTYAGIMKVANGAPIGFSPLC